MERLRRTVWPAVLAAGFSIVPTGCQKPYFCTTEVDYIHYNKVSGDLDHAQYDPQVNIPPGNPRTVRDPSEREKWELSLNEAKAIALANNKQIAVLGYQPGEAGTAIDVQLSAFDAFFSIGGGWSRTDRQATSLINTFGTGANAFKQDSFGGAVTGSGYGYTLTDGAEATQISPGSRPRFGQIPGTNLMTIAKRTATGGLASFGYGLDYQKQVPQTAFVLVNPYWRSSVNFALDQPLLQGAGVEYNRAPTLIARAVAEQSIKTFERDVRTLLRDLEVAYWNLYFTYQDLYSREVGMKQALATWQKEKNKQEVGTGAIPDVAQAREQYEFFRAARLQALQRTLAAERDMRELMGLPPDDDRQIIPKDEPVIAEYGPDWSLGVNELMELRPELQAQRFAIRAAELDLFRQRNGLLPDLTVEANSTVTGLNDEFDTSFNTMLRDNFQDWFFGFRLSRQIGERTAHANVRRSQLALGRERATLRNLEHTYLHDLYEAYQNLITAFELIRVQRDRRQAATQQLDAREQFYRQGKTTIDVLLQAQTTFADALRDESQAIVQYNQSLVAWEFAKGTILENDNVVVAEQRISVTDPKLLKEREWRWKHSIPVPLKKKPVLHEANPDPCPYDPGVLYPDVDRSAPIEALPATEAQQRTPRGDDQIDAPADSSVSPGYRPSSEPAPLPTPPAPGPNDRSQSGKTGGVVPVAFWNRGK